MKKNRKKWIILFLSCAVILTLIPLAYYGGVSKAAETPEEVTRGVVDSLEQLPQYNNEENFAAERGSKNHPFTILEIVPYEEYAEFGYHIGGCEPIDVENLYGRSIGGTLESLGDFDCPVASCYFFSDEPEGKTEMYDSNPTPTYGDWLGNLKGYYERVEDGSGTFVCEIETVTQTQESNEESYDTEVPQETEAQTVSETKTTFRKQSGGNFIWHTLRSDEEEYNKGDLFDAAGQTIENIGDRYYTYRKTSEDDTVIQVNYDVIKNRENFLKQTLRLSDEQAAGYSVVIKTITPQELNNRTEWINYADLIVLSPKSHVGALPELWQKYNRLRKTATAGFNASKTGFSDGRDISWEVALLIYNKVTAQKNYAAIIIDDGVYNTIPESKNVTIDVLDWNMNSSGFTIQRDGSKNNTYKLCVMLLCMDSNLFHSLYLSGDTPIVHDGVISKQTGDAAEYWSDYTFLPVPVRTEINSWDYAYRYWKLDEDNSGVPDYWENYGIYPEISAIKNLVKGHVYTYPGDTSISQSYTQDSQWKTNIYSKEYNDYMKQIGKEGIANPSDATCFILGIGTGGDEPDNTWGTKLRVLDIEPCVALSKTAEDGSTYLLDGKVYSEPKWTLTENYIRTLVPDFTGEIEITHQTTAEFNGKVEDLNSQYDLIYIGVDCGAYNLATYDVNNQWSWKNITLQNNPVGINQIVLPDWNDNSLDGKIYIHTGDLMLSTEKEKSSRTASVKFLYDVNSNTSVDKNVANPTLRFGGNDISRLKQKELQEYVNAGYPVVAATYLYNLEKSIIDENSNIYQFVSENKLENGNRIYSETKPKAIVQAVKSKTTEVTFKELPAIYNGETQNGSAQITNANYLPVDSGRSYLWFSFDVNADGYAYRIYLDSDRNGKFSDEEVVHEGAAVNGNNTYKYRLSTSLVGLLQWKIEVYKTDNPGERFMETGCSAARNNTGVRKKVNVLQIMPKDGSYDGSLNLQNSELFRKYYENLTDYEIKITSITWEKFNSYFKNAGFKYDMSKEIGADNPVNEDKIASSANLSGYNMIIVGFGDTYGSVDLSNQYGAVDYLKYYIAQGKSILFTHDVTSMYNLKKDGKSVFGHTANMQLRDVMGMNRYKAVSNQLSAGEREQVIAYQNSQTDEEGESIYDTISSTALHGFTYYALKRLGWISGNQTVNSQKNYRMPYQYMITNTEGNAVCNVNYATRTTGFNDNNDLTTKASKLNEGQITQYPYKISEDLQIAQTHGQWYQLNVEDPEVTVWYTLSDDHYCAGWDEKDQYGRGTALTYGVSPYDASNNYYIYSKGNVFYSGVGHSTITSDGQGDMEAKLFVNTMIAASRASFEPPVVEITNADAYLSGVQNYTLEVMREYDNGETDVSMENNLVAETFTDSDTVTITFTTVDFNPVSTHLEGWIYLADGEYIDEIVRLSDGAVLHADDTHKFSGLTNGAEYSLTYKKTELDSHRLLKFELKNDRINTKSTTTLNMTVQPLFELD